MDYHIATDDKIDFTFQTPEFYEGEVIAIRGPRRTVVIQRDGEALLRYGEGALSTASEFRDAFPDGILPDDDGEAFEWVRNGWFDIYDTDGEHLDRVHFALDDAITDALRLVT